MEMKGGSKRTRLSYLGSVRGPFAAIFLVNTRMHLASVAILIIGLVPKRW